MAEQYPGRVIAFIHDVTDYDSVPALFQEITGQLGGLDLVVYSAGVMPEVGMHEYSFEKDRLTFEVNVLGAMAWLDQAAIRFENTGHGTIVGIGSVAGDRGRSGQPAYNSSKAALATYLEALRNRLAKRGVTVVTIKPGPVATEMTQHLHLKGAMRADEAARKILEKSKKTGEHYLKAAHQVAFYIIKRIPSPVFRKLKI
jgi:NAD(P)-dependent dehydrogenase (short-subunit alcohol dehydrogenase family)